MAGSLYSKQQFQILAIGCYLLKGHAMQQIKIIVHTEDIHAVINGSYKAFTPCTEQNFIHSVMISLVNGQSKY